METFARNKSKLCLLLACILVPLILCACSSTNAERSQTGAEEPANQGLDTSNFLVAIEGEPDTMDFQCTSIHYTIALNVFNRLVETELDEHGNSFIAPSLAESWEISDDGRTYTFHLREGVTFSNGNPLTSSDVLFTFTRLLTHPDSCNQDIIEAVAGAERLQNGEADTLEGFKVINERDFEIVLDKPFGAFLACLSTPGASIMDEETTELAGGRFGKDPAWTIGTGSFILRSWEPEQRILLVANENCWNGPPRCAGLDLRLITEPEEARILFENGELDVLDLDDTDNAAEFFIHGDIYQDRLFQVQRIATAYIALNETVAPLNDARVRKALQLALNRSTLLNAVYSGLGTVEHGIYPHGLHGFNRRIPEIPYSPDDAKKLLGEAGYPKGFDLTFSVSSSSTQWEMTLARLVASMWEDIGVHATVDVLDEDEFMALRKSGKLACYTATWTADFDDPDNFVYTFFGNRDNTTFRSICYQREDIMERVRNARTIIDPVERIQEYQDLEEIIAQEDAAWIPLFSRLHTYVMSERVESLYAMWNGSVKGRYSEVALISEPDAEER